MALEHKAKVLAPLGCRRFPAFLPRVLAGLGAASHEITWVHCDPGASVVRRSTIWVFRGRCPQPPGQASGLG
jgi:hypothetical protein